MGQFLIEKKKRRGRCLEKHKHGWKVMVRNVPSNYTKIPDELLILL
jgi:hypothetical protein